MTFDLGKARAVDIDILAATDRGELRARYRAAIAEIERLGEMARKWHAAYRKFILEEHAKACEMASKNRCLSKQQATRIKELKADLEQSERVVEARLDVIDQQAARIKELEDALIEERARALWFEGDDPCDPPNLDWKTEPNDIPESVRLLWGESARKQLRAEGKIGPDARIAAWQITDEQKAALGVILARIEYDQSLPGRFNYTVSRAKDTLRAMLEEAQP